ncbi:MAG TPA: SAM-dependent methyltransferase, partial [Acidobacteriota bacterium]|nr:SAM-dependent methyltransferase [Acidobacteriota bacterium]
LSIFLCPVSLLGYVITVIGMYLFGHGSGVSKTAQGLLSARYFQHILGVRQDDASYQLMKIMPGTPYYGLVLVFGPLLLAHRLTGFVPKTFCYPFEGEITLPVEPVARVWFFDNVVARYLASIRQFVILGAGFDTRACRLSKGNLVRCFEVDAPKTQAIKRKLLEKAGIDASGITFVSADFEIEDWLARLVEAGFDSGKPALFLWEGVILYLDREAVESTLRKIAGTAEGSIVAFDYLTKETLESQSVYMRYARAAAKAAGEPFKFGILSTPPLRQRMAEFLGTCGLSLGDHHTLGKETDGKHAWGGFATALVGSAVQTD